MICMQEAPVARGAGFREVSFPRLNQVVAGLLLVAALPLFAVLALAVWVTSGRPIFYSGERMGEGKRPFKLYKFRTLRVGAEARLGGQLVSTSSESLETPLGRHLRACRLDELPQLLNILRGDMNFVGPRPERRAVYEEMCRDIPGYERRFAHRPGLVGFSQVFTPHGTPKRVRARIDNLFYGSPRPWHRDAYLLVCTVWMVARHTGVELAKGMRELLATWPTRGKAATRSRSRELSRMQVCLTSDGPESSSPLMAEVVEISENLMSLRIRGDMAAIPYQHGLEIRRESRTDRRGSRVRRARCRGSVREARWTPEGQYLVIAYQAASEVSDYNLQQYVLQKSMASHLLS